MTQRQLKKGATARRGDALLMRLRRTPGRSVQPGHGGSGSQTAKGDYS